MRDKGGFPIGCYLPWLCTQCVGYFVSLNTSLNPVEESYLRGHRRPCPLHRLSHQTSLDQYTSFAKDPWGFNRPENRKEHNVLSRATFAEWPNTTSNFSLHGGVAPPGKLAAHRKSRFLGLPPGGSETVCVWYIRAPPPPS